MSPPLASSQVDQAVTAAGGPPLKKRLNAGPLVVAQNAARRRPFPGAPSKEYKPRRLLLGLNNIDASRALKARRLGQGEPMKYWEIIAGRLNAEGWSYGIAEHLTKHGLLFCVDAHRDGKRLIVKADDLLIVFLSLEERTRGPSA